MKKMSIRTSYLFLLFVACGCSIDDIRNDSVATSEKSKKCVEVFTLAPVNEAIVTDANGSLATFDSNGTYCFAGSINYPILAKATPSTYVDVDYDNQKSASDLKPMNLMQTSGLKSFCNSINLLTNTYYSGYEENNISKESYKQSIKESYNIDLCSNVLNSEDYAKVNFGIYNKILEDSSTLNSLDDAQDAISRVDNFLSQYLQNSNKKIEYYSAYNALLKLDERKVARIDTIHKPKDLTILNNPLEDGKNMIVNSSFDVFDIKVLDEKELIYLATGHDKLASIDKYTFETISRGVDVNIEDFGNKIYKQDYNGNICGFLVNSNKIDVYDLKSAKNMGSFDGYHKDGSEYTKFATKILNVNGYVSLGENKRLLGIATEDKGYYLFNMKNGFNSNSCALIEKTIQIDKDGVSEDVAIADIEETRDFLIADGADSAYDATFRDDGSYLYVAYGDKGIGGFDTHFLDKDYIANSKVAFSLNSGSKAYNLKLFDNGNELIVTTDEGFEIYNVEDSNELSFVTAYSTEGAKAGYLPQIEIYEDYLLFTDGYKGLKVFKLDSSYDPMLCGVAYFAPNGDPYSLAKVEDVNYYKTGNDVYVVVGVSSYGVAKFKLKDMLFKHCE